MGVEPIPEGIKPRTVAFQDSFRLKMKSAMVIRTYSLCHSGNGKWSGNRWVFAIPPNSHYHSHSLKIPWWWGGSITPVTIFPPQKKRLTLIPTHTVTEIRGHCSEGRKGWGLSLSLFSKKKCSCWRDLNT